MRCSLKPCRNTVTIYERCNEHQRVDRGTMIMMVPIDTKPVATSPDVLPMTPAQKAAKTRAAKKAKLTKDLAELESASAE